MEEKTEKLIVGILALPICIMLYIIVILILYDIIIDILNAINAII